MNLDRLPDDTDDPGRPADTTRLTQSPQPETPDRPSPKPDPPRRPEREPEPKQEREPDRKREPEPEQSAEGPRPAQADSPVPADNTPEPRTRQEHAAPTSSEERELPAANENGAREVTAADEADTSLDVTAQETEEDQAGAQPTDDPAPDDLPCEERSPSDDREAAADPERHDEDPADREHPPNEEASDPSPITRDEGPPEPADATPPVHDRPLPLTDKEWSEHLTEVRDTLDKARAAGLTTDRLYTIDPDRKEWTVERNRLQASLVSDLYERAREVPCDRQAIIAGGLGGAGKTTVLTGHSSIDLSKFLTINPDDIKEEMARRGMIPEMDKLSPMEASDLAHEESSYIAKRLALRAMTEGKSVIWDITMSSRESTDERINNLRDFEYSQVDGVFVHIPPGISVTRTEFRHREGHEQWRAGRGLGGRFVPSEIIHRQMDSEWGSQNRKTFEAVKEKFTGWSIYDNSISGRSPALIDSSDRPAKLIERGSHEQRSHGPY